MKRIMSFMVVGLVLTLVFYILPSLALAEAVIEIKAATMHPMKHRLTDDAFKRYGQEIEKRTKGKVRFKWFLAGSLVQWSKAKEAVTTGLVDMVLVMPVWARLSLYPVTTGLGLPFMFDSPLHYSLAYYKAYHEIPEMRTEYADVKPLGFTSSAMIDIASKGSPPKTLADMKGLKIWARSATSIEMLKLLGASPRKTKVQDIYMSVQRGMVDAIYFPIAPMRSFKLIELLSNHTIGNFSAGPQFYAMNLKKWNSLPPDVQKVFDDLTLSAGCLAGATLTNEDKWVVEELKKRGDTFYYLPPEEKARWVKKTKPVYDAYIADLNKRGMNGQAIFNKLKEAAEWARQNPYQADDWWGRAGRK